MYKAEKRVKCGVLVSLHLREVFVFKVRYLFDNIFSRSYIIPSSAAAAPEITPSFLPGFLFSLFHFLLDFVLVGEVNGKEEEERGSDEPRPSFLKRRATHR